MIRIMKICSAATLIFCLMCVKSVKGMTDIFHGGDVGNIVVQIANNLANKNPFVQIGQAIGQVPVLLYECRKRR